MPTRAVVAGLGLVVSRVMVRVSRLGIGLRFEIVCHFRSQKVPSCIV